MIKFKFILVLLLITLLGCGSIPSIPRAVSIEHGQPFKYDGLKNIIVRSSTTSDVLTHLGKPFRIGLNSDTNQLIYLYLHLGADTGEKAIIEFDDEGAVVNINASKDVVGRITTYSSQPSFYVNTGYINVISIGHSLGSESFLADPQALKKYIINLQEKASTSDKENK